ncbi:MAG TPA: NEW3 domain-containing protein, partial [Pirellulales bacterium]|nr:NEW3 domain-containing protein [Pirellulales bacterium]
SELLLPWRTAALSLSGARYLGTLRLPGGSENRLFVRGKKPVAVVWNSVETTEPIDFADDLHISNVWGRAGDVVAGPHGPSIKVGPLPTFVWGLNDAIVRWKMSVAVDRERLPSVSGVPHYVRVKWQNHFDQSAGGTLHVVGPAGWRVSPDHIDLKMAAGETSQQTLELTVPSTASCGPDSLRFDFDVQAGRHYQFSVSRPIELGLGDVALELTSHLNSKGDLEVEQRLINRTDDRVSFRCHLSIPNRRRMRTQVFKLPPGDDVQIYRLPGGEELLGQPLRVQAEEVGGQRRNLNYTFVAEP